MAAPTRLPFYLVVVLLVLGVLSSCHVVTAWIPTQHAVGVARPAHRQSTTTTTSATNRSQQRWATLSDTNESANTHTRSNKKPYKDLVAFNQALNRLAEQCADPTESVIARAADAEAAYKEAVADSCTTGTGTAALWYPDVISLNTLLKAWKSCCQSMAESSKSPVAMGAAVGQTVSLADISSVPVYTAKDAAQRATDWLNEHLDTAATAATDTDGTNASTETTAAAAPVVQPDVQSFNIVMDAWAKSRAPEAPERVEALLEQLTSLPGLEPDSLTYNALVDAYAYSTQQNRLEKLQKLWADMDRLQKETNGRIKATIRTVNSILHAHGKFIQELESGYNHQNRYDPNNRNENGRVAAMTAAAAEAILRDCLATAEATGELTDQPDVMTYTTVMDAYARCGSLAGAQHAERLLQELKTLYQETKNERYRPNSYTYTTVISAWKRTTMAQGPSRAQELLEELLAETDIAPDSRAFTSTIQCWARSRDVVKATKALQLLQKMKQVSVKWPEAAPTLVSYNTAIDACARTRGDADQQTAALKIAFAVFKAVQVSETMQPNHITYATLLKASAFLMPPGEERNKVAEAVFSKAVVAGMVEGGVIKNLQKATDASVLRRLLGEMQDAGSGHIDFRRIPPAWSKYVR